MKKRKNILCRLRKSGHPNGYVVRSKEDDNIIIYYQPREREYYKTLRLPQKDARLLAKRINQFLDSGG